MADVKKCGIGPCPASVAAPDTDDAVWSVFCERHAESFEAMVEATVEEVS